MKTCCLSNEGVKKKVSRVGFGCANFGGLGSDSILIGKGDSEETAHELLSMAYDQGVNYYDTASTYANGRSEIILGRWMRSNGIPREEIVVSSKVSALMPSFFRRGGLSGKHITREVERSLKRLQTDYLDILYTHAPNPIIPLEETLSAMSSLVRQGKVRALGASNVDADHLRQCLSVSRANNLLEYQVVQNSFSLLDRRDELELIPVCKKNNILYVAYGSLCGGLLAGKYSYGVAWPKNSRLDLRPGLYRDVVCDRTFAVIGALKTLAEGLGIELPTLVYAWLDKKAPIDIFLVGSRSRSQFRPFLEAADVVISPADWDAVDRISSCDGDGHC
jgi:aryl-alcohol dehydrogenase-like predicted oxidoreductase